MMKKAINQKITSPHKAYQQIRQKKQTFKTNDIQKARHQKLSKHHDRKQNIAGTEIKKIDKATQINKNSAKNIKKKCKQTNQYALAQQTMRKAENIKKQKTEKKIMQQKQPTICNNLKQIKPKMLGQHSHKNVYTVSKQKKTLLSIKKMVNQSCDNRIKTSQDSREKQKNIHSLHTIRKDQRTPKTQRYRKFQIRSSKYSKILQQLKMSNPGNKQLGQQQNIRKPKSSYKKRIEKLNKQIENYKILSSKSQRTLKKLESIKAEQEKQQKQERQAFIDQIMKIKEQILQYKPNLGHLFSYPQFRQQYLIPQLVIPEGTDESKVMQNKSKIQNNYEQIIKKGQQIITKYSETYDENENMQQSEVNEVCLSITSKSSQN